jgi:hypothetical protein
MKCKVDSCNQEVKQLGYCTKHYKQYYRHGKILERTRFDPNEIISFDTYAEIVIYDKYNNPKDIKIIIDLDDIDKVKNLKWSIDSKGYPITTINKTEKVRLHRYILGLQEDLPVDHINKNRLDNRKINLRLATNSDNNANKSMQKNNTSGFTGVTWDKNQNKWMVVVQYYKESYNLGHYKDKDVAISVRLKGEQLIFKEFAPNIKIFDLIMDDLINIETIEELKEQARKIDNILIPPKRNRLSKTELKNLYNDTFNKPYNRKELALKYKCSLSSIDVHIRQFKIKGAINIE